MGTLMSTGELNMQAILFDVDGTLLDTEHMYMLALQAVLADAGYQVSYEQVYATFGLPSVEALAYLGFTKRPDLVQAWQERCQNYQARVQPFPGIRTMLTTLGQHYQLGLVTSNQAAEFLEHDRPFNLSTFFPVQVFAGQTKRRKPAPDPINLALKQLACPPGQALYIGDSLHDMQAAHAAQANFGLAGWGTTVRQPFLGQADAIFEEPAAVSEQVGRL
ncbi:phosphatase [Weissella halotolerans DSM 20190]|uniref:Phosphatase n=2 Tax=Weissella halotolerans TaxID=1615 RepID=A0A0R2FYU1_9LACO|nr:phosphatase [Weissella halotolerans DSM 20190]